MENRVFDRRGRQNWSTAIRNAEDRRMRNRRRSERRVAQRRQGNAWPEGARQVDKRVAERRALDRRSALRRSDEPRRVENDEPHPAKSYDEALVSDFIQLDVGCFGVVASETLLEEVLGKISASDVGMAFIFGENEKLVGVVTEGDCVRQLSAKGQDAFLVKASSVMSGEYLFCEPQDRLQDAVVTMASNRLRHLPVLENNTVVGVLSAADMLTFFAGETD